MLRYEYMPSDFHPLFLIIGDAADLARLSAVLRRSADHGEKILLVEAMPEFRARTPLTIVPADGEFGLRQLEQTFVWRLNAWQAQSIADRVEALASQDARSGSEIFEIGSDGEIPVKVSRGEFTDDFLISKR